MAELDKEQSEYNTAIWSVEYLWDDLLNAMEQDRSWNCITEVVHDLQGRVWGKRYKFEIQTKGIEKHGAD